MPYAVVELAGLYDEETKKSPGTPHAEILTTYLNEMEADGWRVVGVVPDTQIWDEDGHPDGKSASTILLHREAAKPAEPWASQ